MSVGLSYYSFQDLKAIKGFDPVALGFALKGCCPFYSFLTYGSTTETSSQYIVCQIHKLNHGDLSPTISNLFEEKIPCYIINQQVIDACAKKIFYSKGSDDEKCLEFDLVDVLVFSGPYQYFYKETVPNWESHFQKHEEYEKGACNVCNYQAHATSVLPDLFLQINPKDETNYKELTSLVSACLKNKFKT